MTSSRTLPQLGTTVSRADLVAETIRTSILNGTLKPGDILAERQLADQLGVSKTPVREALIGLSQTKLLVANRNKGMTVRTLSSAEVRHVYEERLLLEPWALRRTIEDKRTDFTNATQALREAETHATDPAAKVMANRRFHQALYSECENRLVVDTLNSLQDIVALAAITVFWRKWSTSNTESHEHENILTAAINGDATQAESMLRDHIQASITRITSET